MQVEPKRGRFEIGEPRGKPCPLDYLCSITRTPHALCSARGRASCGKSGSETSRPGAFSRASADHARNAKMRFVVASHGHCFDGLSSAVVFTRLMKELGAPEARFEYRTCGYGAGQARAD